MPLHATTTTCALLLIGRIRRFADRCNITGQISHKCRNWLVFDDLGLLTFLALASFFTFATRTTFLTLRSACIRLFTRCFFYITLVPVTAFRAFATFFVIAFGIAATTTTVITATTTITAAFARFFGGFRSRWCVNRRRSTAEP